MEVVFNKPRQRLWYKVVKKGRQREGAWLGTSLLAVMSFLFSFSVTQALMNGANSWIGLPWWQTFLVTPFLGAALLMLFFPVYGIIGLFVTGLMKLAPTYSFAAEVEVACRREDMGHLRLLLGDVKEDLGKKAAGKSNILALMLVQADREVRALAFEKLATSGHKSNTPTRRPSEEPL